MESCLSGYRTALRLLEDGNNDRITWITSARIVQRANELTKLVSAAPHIAVMEVERELFRERAANVLGLDDHRKGEWFFRGLDSPEKNSEHSAGSQPILNGRRPTDRSRLPELSRSSIATIYELASYPSNYEEPLVDNDLELRVGIEMRASFPGLFDYLVSNANRDRASPSNEA